MNENTREQWERYCATHPSIKATDCLVLFWLVHEHSAAEGITRPGEHLLAARTHADQETVRRALKRLAEDGHIALARPYSKGNRKAAEYRIAWLRNPVRQAKHEVAFASSYEGANTTVNAKANAPTSTPLRGVRAHSRSNARAAAVDSARESIQAKPCARCESTGSVKVGDGRYGRGEFDRCPECNPEPRGGLTA